MFAIIHLLATFIADLFKSPRRLEVENLFLRHQLNVALRRGPQRVRLRAGDRALMVWMTRMWPSLLGLTQVVQPATILRWHRCGFRAYWRWKSRGRPGRPRVGRELRELIVPIRRSTYAFCQGDLGEIGRSRIPIVRSRRVKACPYARSLSRSK